MKAEIIVVQLHSARLPVTKRTIASLLKSPSKPITVRPKSIVTLDSQGILQLAESPAPSAALALKLNRKGSALFGGVKFQWSNSGTADLTTREGCLVFDSTCVGNKIVLRHPEPGDRVRLSGRSSARPLMDIVNRNKIPREKRRSLVVATTSAGKIFWVEGLRITEDFKVTDKTTAALKWNWKREEAPKK